LDYIDAYGLDQLTMRRLGKSLGVEGMSIYRYAAGREQLVEAVVAHVLREVYIEMTGRRWPTWQLYARHLAHAIRRIALEHPALFRYMASSQRPMGGLRPPLRDVDLVEDFLSTLQDDGLTDSEAVEVYRGLTGFLLGHLLLESAERAPARAEDLGSAAAIATLSPAVQRVLRGVTGQDDRIQFERELGALMRRLGRAVERQVR